MTKLRQFREEQGWSQRELADLVHLSQPTVCRVERGEMDLLPQQKVRVARALKCRITDLFGPSDMASAA